MGWWKDLWAGSKYPPGYYNDKENVPVEPIAPKSKLLTSREQFILWRNTLQTATDEANKLIDAALREASLAFVGPSTPYRIIKFDATAIAECQLTDYVPCAYTQYGRSSIEYYESPIKAGYYVQQWHKSPNGYYLESNDTLTFLRCVSDIESAAEFERVRERGYYGHAHVGVLTQEKIDEELTGIANFIKDELQKATLEVKWNFVQPKIAHPTHAAAAKWLKAWINPETVETYYDEHGNPVKN
jgi:hypothetical protein